MSKTISFLREAASTLVVAKSPAAANVKGLAEKVHPSLLKVTAKFDYKVLLLKRASESKFLPNMYIFPGGVSNKADFDAAWFEILKRDDFPTYLHSPPAFKKKNDSGLPCEVGFSICATRETFEESGILLCAAGDGKPININDYNVSDITEWREKIQKDPAEFMKMCLKFGFYPDIKSNYLWANWMTPAHMEAYHGGTSRRFDTLFYIHGLSEIPVEKHDQMETVSSEWASPPELLYHFKKRNVIIGLPQLFELCRLCHFPKYDDLCSYMKERAKQGVERYVGIRHDATDGHFLVFPGDSIYPKDPMETERDGPFKVSVTVEESMEAAVNLNRVSMGTELSDKGLWDMVIHCTTGNECGHNTPIPEEDILEGVTLSDVM